jgi:DeoR/GlpR family transcriptional regulator of sugar metabolism
MFKKQRLRQIRERLRHQHQVRVDELAESFGVSKMTIRRDLRALEVKGEIERTHGGAIATTPEAPTGDSTWSRRLSLRSEEKAAIAKHVADQVGQGETLYLSPGTTTFHLARVLAERSDLSIITSSLAAACYLAENSELNLIVLGGALRRPQFSMARILMANNLEMLEMDQLIVGCEGIHPVFGISNEVPPEYGTDRIVIGDHRKAIVLADPTKVGKVATYKVAPIERIRTLVTTEPLSELMVEKFEERGVEVQIAPPLVH